MGSNTALIVSLIGIALAIIGGAKFKVNTGVSGIVLAFLIGTLFCGMKLSKVLDAWPYSITFFIVIINLFYGFATANGTMKVLAMRLLKLMKGKAAFLLPVVAVACIILGILGAPAPTMIGPIAFSVALETGISPIAVTMFVAIASTMGSDNPFTGQAGIISMGLIEDAGYAEQALDWAVRVWMHNCLKAVIVLVIVYFLFKCYKGKDINALDLECTFNPEQKKTIYIVLFSIFLCILPVILKFVAPKAGITATLSNLLGTNFCFSLGAILMILFKTAKYEDAIKRIPMNTIIMIGGMNLLMGVAKQAGLVDTLATFLGTSVPKFWIPGMIVIIAGFLSFFSGGTSVVCPLLYPIVPALSAASGLNPVMLFSCVFVGAMSSSTSPYSRGGATAISTCPDAKVQDELTTKVLPITLLVWILCAVLATLGLFNVFAPRL